MIVLDAAALVDVIIDQPTREWVLDQLAGQDIAAPAHQLAEVVSAIGRLVRAGDLSATGAIEAVEEATGLAQELVVPSAAHLRRALELQGHVRVLDGLYVALAEQRRARLVTTDRRLAAAGLPVEVVTPAR